MPLNRAGLSWILMKIAQTDVAVGEDDMCNRPTECIGLHNCNLIETAQNRENQPDRTTLNCIQHIRPLRADQESQKSTIDYALTTTQPNTCIPTAIVTIRAELSLSQGKYEGWWAKWCRQSGANLLCLDRGEVRDLCIMACWEWGPECWRHHRTACRRAGSTACQLEHRSAWLHR